MLHEGSKAILNEIKSTSPIPLREVMAEVAFNHWAKQANHNTQKHSFSDSIKELLKDKQIEVSENLQEGNVFFIPEKKKEKVDLNPGPEPKKEKVDPNPGPDAKKKEIKKQKEFGEKTLIATSSFRETKENILRMADYMYKFDLLPDSFNTPAKAVMGIQTAVSFGYRTCGQILMATKFMYIVNKRIELFGELPLAIVRASNELELIKEFFINKNYEEICLENKNLDDLELAAVCQIKRKGKSEKPFYITVKDLHRSGVIVNEDKTGWVFKKGKTGTWTNYYKDHWKFRARRKALNSEFSDVLGGIHITIQDKEFVFDENKEKTVNSLKKDLKIE